VMHLNRARATNNAATLRHQPHVNGARLSLSGRHVGFAFG